MRFFQRFFLQDARNQKEGGDVSANDTPQGFSFVEVLIVLAIVSLLMILVVPSQELFYQRTLSHTSHSQLLQSINLARTEAMNRDATIILCGTENFQTCSPQWSQGYLLLNGKKVLSVFKNDNQGILHWRGSLGLTYLKFFPNGLINSTDGTFWYCAKHKINPAWALVMNHAGRARAVWPDKHGKIFDARGKELDC